MTLAIIAYFLVTRILSISCVVWYYKSTTPLSYSASEKESVADSIVGWSIASFFGLEMMAFFLLLFTIVALFLIGSTKLVAKIL